MVVAGLADVYTFAIAIYLSTMIWFCWRPSRGIEDRSIPICFREIVSACCHSSSALWVCSFSIWSIWVAFRWWADYFWGSNVSADNVGSIPVAIVSVRSRSNRAHADWWICWTSAAAERSANCGSGRSFRFHLIYLFCANALDFRWDSRPLGSIDRNQAFFVRAIRYHCCPMCTHPLCWFFKCVRACVCGSVYVLMICNFCSTVTRWPTKYPRVYFVASFTFRLFALLTQKNVIDLCQVQKRQRRRQRIWRRRRRRQQLNINCCRCVYA